MPPRIALLIESSRGSGRLLLRGVAAYAREHGPWTFFLAERLLGDAMPRGLARWRPDGILARIENPNLLKQLRRLNVPTVDLFHEEGLTGFSGVFADSSALVRLAVTHLHERGFKCYAYCGYRGVGFSDRRAKFFQEQVDAVGGRAFLDTSIPLKYSGHLLAAETAATYQVSALGAWLAKLPKPLGVVNCSDMRAREVLMACEERGLRVPEDVAVIGMGNDEVWCEVCSPPLSSVDVNAQTIGYTAAALLDRLLQGRANAQKLITVEPAGVITRRSTDVLAFAQRDVAEAVRFVWEHACKGVRVQDVCTSLSISPRTLNRWFLAALGRSPEAEIDRVRFNRVVELLSRSDLPLTEVSLRAGFQHTDSLCKFFRRMCGQTPGQFRRQTHTSATPPRSPAER